jgi:PTH1 family peptidyl-tRNA hydrolase
MENLYLIVGLGNPGRAYAGTRHNAGYMVVDRLAARWKAAWKAERKFNAHVARVERNEKKLFLCRPDTLMNSSGEVVGPLAAYYQAPLERLLVVVDEADLPLGQIRLRPRGSAGGHHGLQSVLQHLGGQDFPRLRVGIGRESPESREIHDYVLAEFGATERELLEKVLLRACDQIECWLDHGILRAMNHFNGTVTV